MAYLKQVFESYQLASDFDRFFLNVCSAPALSCIPSITRKFMCWLAPENMQMLHREEALFDSVLKPQVGLPA